MATRGEDSAGSSGVRQWAASHGAVLDGTLPPRPDADAERVVAGDRALFAFDVLDKPAASAASGSARLPRVAHSADAALPAKVTDTPRGRRGYSYPRGQVWARLLDVLLAGSALLFLAPLMLLVAIAIRLTSRGPALFRHRRIGRGGRPFHCYKFRSMVADADMRLAALLARDLRARREWERDHKLAKDPRITWFGRFLRRSSLDELPQLFNVLGGSMSLVGPRPIVDAEVARYGRYFAEYCRVAPGITGLWQVCGRSTTSYRRRVAMDVLFVRRRGLSMYLHVLARTVPVVMTGHGAR